MKNFLSCMAVAVVVACVMGGASTFAEDQNSVVTKVTAGTDNAAGERQVVLTPVEQKMQKLISVDFRNTPMEDVIRVLAAQADIDIVKSPNVVGNVTATLTNVPLGEALSNILSAHGYAYVADKHLIRVVTKAEVGEQQEALVNKVYQITYADVKDVEASLKKFISPRGSISSNPGTNNIIVTDTEGKIRSIDTFINEVDRVTPQVLVEARIYDITSTENYDLGIDWQAGRNTEFANIAGGTANGSVTTTAGPNPLSGKVSPFASGVFGGSGAGKTNSVSGALRLGMLNSAVDIDAVIKAQKENIEAKLLANPRVLVLDNETAKMDIVHEIPYQQLNQGMGVQSFGTIEFKEVGVKLKVTPHITREGMIRIKLQPEFSVQAESVNVGDPSLSASQQFKVPSIDKRQADTTLLIKDGQTVVLGGLRKKDVAKQVNKVPLLGDLPILGALFKFTSEATAFSEIVVFVTPHIISQPLATSDMNAGENHAYKSTEFKEPKPTMTEAEKAAKKE